ncbi:hemicentin-1-like isoform X1 [Mya arenaria]|uniref:hemicentin-1-like isoform X1 n=1 Tax=Mya arenaria TaxID=6604 RepID=UPI0022E4BC58|nr:hemicentin-1-like isoform X1 [Mya arenaria]
MTTIAFWCLIAVLKTLECTNVTLTIEPQVTFENNSVLYKCTAGYDAPVLELSSGQSPTSLSRILYSIYTVPNCTVKFAINSTVFIDSCSCDKNNLVCITESITREQSGFWKCQDFFASDRFSNLVELRVSVPITEAIIASDELNVITINDTEQLTLTCEAPDGLPAANISWFLDNRFSNVSNDDENITALSVVENYPANDGLSTAVSNVTLNASAGHNGMAIYCTASNIAGIMVVSRRIHLNVRYKSQTTILVNNQTNDISFYLMRNSNINQSLKCQVYGGNPLATLKWSCYDGIQSDENSQSSAISTVTWIATDLTESTCNCSASNIFGWTDRRVVYIHVYYEPTPPVCTLGNTTLHQDVINIILNTSLSITCNSEGNPSPDNFTWMWPTSNISEGKTLSISNVQISHDGLYTLSVQNLMEPSIGQVVNGRSNATFDINIQYGPRNPNFVFGHNGKNIPSGVVSVIKGKEISIVAFADANPTSSYKWSNNQVGETISQVFNYDVSISCNISNELNPIGASTIQQSITEILQFEVLYPPEVPILQFKTCNRIIGIQDSILKVLVDQPLNVTCFVKAKPEPSFKWNNALSSELVFANTSKIYSATYVCNAHNTMNTSYGEILEGQKEISFYLDVLYPPKITNVEIEFVACRRYNI